ncbi:TetR/AcrR family transcriptional regulator [Paenibacillus whitsoniae]|uniref:TetR/AcrR family transcriptional regulator n=1 Tax=Paenibacillus whitsoniae TaxID=2496558 RepID=A0A3S0CYP2_9BACL|nr:TetR/AcrR family transcriptional regulator [Paenibacillus whitsoniae]RTE11816.1 TetR/AcrR family transcriptional regulator [Paenibacillus whitsoniae]
MGRKQSFTETELLDVTKRLILEHGYDGFHLKLLSQHLSGARSTIYQYYSNKEEIVAACMKRVISQIMQNASSIDETDAMSALQQLLHVYMEESKLHQLLGDASKIKTQNVKALEDLAFVEQAHSFLKVQLSRLFEQAQKEGKLREDLPLPVLIGTFFNLINTPNLMNVPTQQWSSLLFQIWIGGSKR